MNVRIGHRGDRWVELGAWHAVTGEARRFCDATGALLFLRERMTVGDIRALRGLLTRVNAASRPLDDAALLRLVAHCLHSRTLKAVLWHERRYSVAQQLEAWQAPRVELPAPAPRESAPVAELPIAPPPRPAPVPALSDGEAQAIALRKAASSGVACCEICERVPPPRPAEPALLADSEPEGQAEALREAARDGLPFCEICQRVPSPAPPPPTARPVPATPPPSPPPPSPVDTLPADSDPVAQAATLRAAASEGTPFCAICQRASAAAPEPA